MALVCGCGGGNKSGLFGGNDELDAGDGQAPLDASSPDGSTNTDSEDSAAAPPPDGATPDTTEVDGGTNTDDDSDGGPMIPTSPEAGSDSGTPSTTASNSSSTSSNSTSEPNPSTDAGTSNSTDSGTSSDDVTSEPPPTCVITTPAKTLLNGVLAPEGDRVSSSGAYAVRVAVSTSQPDGSTVLLSVSGGAPVSATSVTGVATFASVPLPEGEQSELQATCQGQSTVQSAVVRVDVDTQPPELDADNITPVDGQQLLPSDDNDPATPGASFDVCVPVTSADALDIGSDNVCVNLDGTQTCVPAAAAGASNGADGACVRVQCEGDDPFDLGIAVTDAAGNSTTHTAQDVQCTTSNLVVSIVDRRHTSFQLDWAPSAEPVIGYEIAYTKADSDDAAPIDEVTFDDATDIELVGPEVHAFVLENLTIEQRYHFAVRPLLESAEPAPVTATSTPLRARFLTQIIQPPAGSTGNQWGYSVDASTDLNDDGASDLVVGQGMGDRVTIYLGHVDGTFSSAPDVTINGPAGALFGVSVALVGDLFDTGTEVLAIAASEDANGKVYLLPTSALTAGVIDLTDGANPFGPVIEFPAGPGYPTRVARLGDFDGDAIDDFAIHAAALGQNGACDFDTGDNCNGALVVVRGGDSMPNTIDVPDNATRSFAFFPSTFAFGFYGTDWLLGVTELNDSQSGVVAAEWQDGITRLISFDDTQTDQYVAQTLSVGAPDFDIDPPFDTELGLYPPVLTGESTLAVQLTAGRTGNRVGVVELYTLQPTNTFATDPVLSLTALGNNNNAGQVLIGARFGGRPLSYSLPLFGSEVGTPLVLAGRYFNDNLPILYMLRSDTLEGLPSTPDPVDVAVVADIAFELATVPGIFTEWENGRESVRITEDWHGGLGFPIHDLNGDGYMDLGIAEWNSDTDYAGGIVVLY